MKKLFYILTFCVVGFLSCKHETVIPSDTEAISFKTKIKPIITINCTSGCHEHTGNGERSFTYSNSIELDTNKLKSYITSGKPHSSNLYTSMTSLISPMPPNGNMPENNILLIYTWIEQGANYSN